MPEPLEPPDMGEKITSDDFMVQALWIFLVDVADQINKLQWITGTGSPEGVVTADPGQNYYDTAANLRYFKESGYEDTGWVQA